MSKQYGLKLVEQLSLQRFGEEVRQHDRGRAVPNGNIGILHHVLNPKITDIDMARFWSRR